MRDSTEMVKFDHNADRLEAERPTLNAAAVPLIEQYIRAIRTRLIPISLIMAISIVFGVVITLLMTPLYTAESRIEISRKPDNVTNVEGAQDERLDQDLEFYQTQYALLEARTLAQRVVRSLKLVTNNDFWDMYGVDPGDTAPLQNTATRGLRSSERAALLDAATEILLDDISIRPIRGSSLVDVQFTSPNASLSANVSNEWVNQFIESNLDRRFSSTSDARKFLEKRLETLRDRLEESERRLVGYASNKAIITLATTQDIEGKTTTQRTLVAADLEALNASLAEATAARIKAESEARQRDRTSRAALDNSAINVLRAKRAEIVSERANLLSQFEPEYPTVAALAAQVQALDRSIDTEEARIKSGSTTNYREALRREAELSKKVGSLKSKFISQQRDRIQYNIFQREVDTNRELYDGLLQRYKEIGVAGVGQNNIAVVDPAMAPAKPSSPSLPLNLALALLAGLGISAAYIYANEQIDQSLKDPQDVERILGMSLLGTVPDVGPGLVEGLMDSKSIESEAYFSIGTSLSFMTAHGIPRSLMVTSSQPNEGKSTTAYALAVILARMGKKVILVDADMRNSSAHNFVEIPNDTGFSNYLSGQDDYSPLVLPTQNPRLFVMTGGPTPPNAAELLSSDRASKLIKNLEADFDHVIIDAPPVLGIADIPLLANVTEGIIYTIEANRLKIRAIEAALLRLQAASANIFGAIVTKLDSRNSSYGYGYGYGYGEADDKDEQKPDNMRD